MVVVRWRPAVEAGRDVWWVETAGGGWRVKATGGGWR